MKIHPDLDKSWCKNILLSPGIENVEIPARPANTTRRDAISNTMFERTLYTDSAIRAQINFRRPTKEPDSLTATEMCYLLSLGDGVDGKAGRAHGGFNALILDHITGTVASQLSGSFAPATATLTIDYKAPIDTPGVFLCRGWPIEWSGRKVWVKANIEDETGRVLATGKALFISPRTGKI